MEKLLCIIPAYNTEKYIEGAIESVLQQENVNLHLCIIDDCSTDNTFNVINKYTSYENVTILQNEINRGTYYSQNRGLELLKNGSYTHFTIHGSDDITVTNRYRIMLDMFDNNVYFVPTVYMRLDERYFTSNSINYEMGQLHNGLGNGIGVYRTEIFNNIGYYDNSRFGADTDYYFRATGWCKLHKKNYNVCNEILYIARERSDRLAKTHTDRSTYIQKINNDINDMTRSKNFYRNKFK